MKKLLISVTIAVSLLAITSALFYYYANNRLNTLEIKNQYLLIEIPQGSSLNQCINILNNESLFEPGWFFNIYFRLYSKLNNCHINAGTYRFTSAMDNKTILESLFYGKNLYTIKVTYPEGITLTKFAEITEKKFGISITDFIEFINSHETLEKYGIKANTAEGYLMPDTYTFFRDVDLKTIAERLFKEQQNIWESKFESQAKSMKLSKHQVLTLASIIEAETPVAEERARVSGVYHNRLRKNMLLQADPTVAYILSGKENLTYRDLKIINPFNTYLYTGLPPGPINSPSLSSIEAALNPEKNEYIYFVAKGDGSNRHNFSVTFGEHQRNISLYRKNRRVASKWSF